MMRMQEARLGLGLLTALGLASALAAGGSSPMLAQSAPPPSSATPAAAPPPAPSPQAQAPPSAPSPAPAGGAHAGHGQPPAVAGDVACRRWTPPVAEALDVRVNVTQLVGFRLAGFRKGVEVMQSRSATDPTSWRYQANMHGTFDDGDKPGWNSCQHGSYFFLSWHRMYLYFFERILRSASGTADLTLPYWNYSDPAARALPQPYRYPARTSNALWVQERDTDYNNGLELPAEATDYEPAFAYTNFSAPPPTILHGQKLSYSFGGEQITQPVQDTGLHGEFEYVPHDAIHVLIGGQTGYMSIPQTAARDPIFFAHHANIDRLWGRWLQRGGGRANPSKEDLVWQQTRFTFFDETGACILMTGAEVIDTARQLGYRYDDEASAAPVGQTTRATLPPTDGRAAAGQTEGGDLVLLAETDGTRLELSGARQTLSVAIKPEQKAAVLALAQGGGTPPSQLALFLDGVDNDQGAYYTVYLNLPSTAARPSSTSPHYVGILAPFASKGHGAGPDGTGRRLFDLSRVVARLTAEKLWKGDELTVTFVPGSAVRPKTGEPSRSTTAKLRIARLRIVAST